MNEELLEKFAKEVEQAPAIAYDDYIYADFSFNREHNVLTLDGEHETKDIKIISIEVSDFSFWINDDREVAILEYKKVK